MGKDRNRKSLIRLIANTIVHKIVAEHTNRPESKEFLNSEVIEYRSQTEKMSKNYNWNDEAKGIIKEKALEQIKKKMSFKYSDVSFSHEEAEGLIDGEITNIGI